MAKEIPPNEFLDALGKKSTDILRQEQGKQTAPIQEHRAAQPKRKRREVAAPEIAPAAPAAQPDPKKELAKQKRRETDRINKNLRALKDQVAALESSDRKGVDEKIRELENEIYALEGEKRTLKGKKTAPEPVVEVQEPVSVQKPTIIEEEVVVPLAESIEKTVTTEMDGDAADQEMAKEIAGLDLSEKIPAKQNGKEKEGAQSRERNKMEIVLPEDPHLRAQLEAKLKEYEDRIATQRNPQERILNGAKITILENLLKRGNIHYGRANTLIGQRLPEADQKILAQAFSVIKAHVEGRSEELSGGTGLPKLEVVPEAIARGGDYFEETDKFYKKNSQDKELPSGGGENVTDLEWLARQEKDNEAMQKLFKPAKESEQVKIEKVKKDLSELSSDDQALGGQESKKPEVEGSLPQDAAALVSSKRKGFFRQTMDDIREKGFFSTLKSNLRPRVKNRRN